MTTFKVKILFDFESGASNGGNRFLSALREELLKMDAYTHSLKSSDLVLLNSIQLGQEKQYYEAYRAYKQGKAVIHRIAGPISGYRPQDHLRDQAIYLCNELFSSGNIFQSKWSRRANYDLGMKPISHETVIFNAPDPRFFYLKDHFVGRREKLKIISSSWSSNWRKGFEDLQFLDEHLDFNQYEMIFVGNSPVTFKHIKMLGTKAPLELGHLIRDSDVFLFPSRIEACSNALLEGMHSCPLTLAYAGSSNIEIVNDPSCLYRNPGELLSLLEAIRENKELVPKPITLPKIDAVVSSYYQFFKKVFLEKQKESRPAKYSKIKLLKLLLLLAVIKAKR